MRKLYNLGSLNIDYVYQVPHFLQPGETLSAKERNIFPGGKGLNQSVAAARAGAAVVHGAMASYEARFLLDLLSDSGVDTKKIRLIDQPAGHTIIQVNPSGQNCILLFAGTNHSLTKEYVEEFLSDANPGDILLLQNETNCLKEALQLAAIKKMEVALNPSPFDASLSDLPLSMVKWWFCNEIEAKALFGSDDPSTIAQTFCSTYPDSCLILTLGEQGSMYINCDETITQPIFKVKTVDTTAAGDTFTGYFLSSIIAGYTCKEAMCRAAKASAIAVSREGAAVSVPYEKELSKWK